MAPRAPRKAVLLHMINRARCRGTPLASRCSIRPRIPPCICPCLLLRTLLASSPCAPPRTASRALETLTT
eukprot:3284172-Pyramimonas_sp.AAC.1